MTNIKAKKVILKNRDGEHLIPITDVDALNYKNITNCLLEVPQNIKLELENGTLTLKAGSKVIVPNGVGVFDEVSINSDVKISSGGASGNKFWLYEQATNTLKGVIISNCYTGNSAPSGTGYQVWYNTSENKIYTDWSKTGTWVGDKKASLPLCTYTSDGTSIISIDQVFNGMGYIGSTVWVDKGVKGLKPNGRNADGTLNNQEFTLDTLQTLNTFTSSATNDYYAVINGDDNTLVRSVASIISYDEQNNYMYREDGILKVSCIVAKVSVEGNNITSFQPKLPFHAVDYNDLQGKVSKTGDTMSGHLQFEGTAGIGLFGGSIYTHTMDMALDDKPSSGNKYYAVVQHEDKNMARKSRLESYWATDGSHGVQLSEKKNASTGSYANLLVGFDASGNAYTYAPHSSYTNSIVTQAGLSKSGNGYIKFGNGIIIQWGYSSATTATRVTTLPTAFTSTNYRVVAQHEYLNGSSHHTITITAYTKTSFTMWSNSTSANATFHWIAIGY